MQSLSPRGKQILLAAVALVLILAVIGAGVVLGRTLSERSMLTPPVVVPVTPIAAEQTTATLAAQPQATPAPQRVAVPDGRVETETGIAILPVVKLQGDRRYVLQITSKAGAVSFQGSYSLGSIEPKIAINPMTEIKGTMPWEQEILPPAPDARQWTLGASVSATPIGKNIQVQVWDIGPK
jgi:hypothetical protein